MERSIIICVFHIHCKMEKGSEVLGLNEVDLDGGKRLTKTSFIIVSLYICKYTNFLAWNKLSCSHSSWIQNPITQKTHHVWFEFCQKRDFTSSERKLRNSSIRYTQRHKKLKEEVYHLLLRKLCGHDHPMYPQRHISWKFSQLPRKVGLVWKNCTWKWEVHCAAAAASKTRIC
jgi:hypothetical protein